MALSKVIYCKACGAAIRFIDLPSGKRMPVDAAYTEIYETWPAEKFYLTDGTQVEGMENAAQERRKTQCYRPHFGTCTKRKLRRAQQCT